MDSPVAWLYNSDLSKWHEFSYIKATQWLNEQMIDGYVSIICDVKIAAMNVWYLEAMSRSWYHYSQSCCNAL